MRLCLKLKVQRSLNSLQINKPMLRLIFEKACEVEKDFLKVERQRSVVRLNRKMFDFCFALKI